MTPLILLTYKEILKICCSTIDFILKLFKFSLPKNSNSLASFFLLFINLQSMFNIRIYIGNRARGLRSRIFLKHQTSALRIRREIIFLNIFIWKIPPRSTSSVYLRQCRFSLWKIFLHLTYLLYTYDARVRFVGNFN